MLGDEIGRGAHGIVYKGLNLENGEFVAIKQVSLENIKDEDLKNIMQEIDLLKNLNHKNIVKYLGSSMTTSHLHIFLEYVENGSLANIIKPANFGPFPESLVAVYITQVLEGLVYLHEQGVIHRDIKGANILTTKEGLVKLADFGVATKLTDTNSNESAGTAYWMAPEVINMSGVCAASDIWSVGCTVIELLTGLPPYYDLGPWPALWQIVQDTQLPLPDSLSPVIMNFLRLCFRKDYRQRLDAKTLLSHPWIQRSRRMVHSPLRDSETSSEQALLSKSLCSEDAETSNGDDQNSVDNLHAKKSEDSETEFLKVDTADVDKNAEHNPLRGIFGDPETSSELHQVSDLTGQDKMLVNDETGSPTFSSKSIISRKVCVEESSNHAENGSSSASSKSQEYSPPKGVEYSRLISSLRPDEPEDVLVSACQKLTAFFHQSPEQRLGFLTQHGFVPLVELLEVPNIRVICSVLQVLNEITRDSTEIQESACLAGLIPTVMGFAVPDRPHEIRMEAAKFLHQFCHSSRMTLHMFIACRGITILVSFLEADYKNHREMVHLAIDGLWQVFKLQWSSSRNDLFRIAAKTGILLRLISTLYSLNEATQLAAISTGEVSGCGREHANLEPVLKSSWKVSSTKVVPPSSSGGAVSALEFASQRESGVLSGSGVLSARPRTPTSSRLNLHMAPHWNADVMRRYIDMVVDLLLRFAESDTTVKSYMCSHSMLCYIFQMFNKIEPAILLKLLKCINYLSNDPHCLENLQRADAIKHLVPNLDLKTEEGPLVSQIHHEALNALFNLCKLNKRRQEQAAKNGIIPHLMHYIMSGSPLKKYALPLLFDMAHASSISREQVRAHGGLDVYLSLLEEDIWSVTALDSIALCLAHDNDKKKVEQAMLRKDVVQKLVNFFQSCPQQHFLHILEPFLKIITKSSRISNLAAPDLMPLLISRLDDRDAMARLNLLKLIKAVYEHHPRPKQLIVANDLCEKIQNLIEEHQEGQSSGGHVLVKQMATSLLKALHVNTIL
ncbi:hypothetical protein AgCh_029434 [Apium graveolens]